MTSGSSFSLGRRQPTHLISARRAPWKEPKPRAEKAPVWTYNGRERIPPGGTHSTGLVGQWLLPGDHQEVSDAELIAIMRGVHHRVSRREQGKSFTIFTDSQAAMWRLQHDAPGPGQDGAREMIEPAHALREQGNTVAIRWVLGYREAGGGELAELYARTAAGLGTPD